MPTDYRTFHPERKKPALASAARSGHRWAMSDPVLYSREGHIGLITLNRPEARNSMTPELLDGFAEVLKEVRADREARVHVLTGTGRCFSAGADFKAGLQKGREDQLPHERSFGMYEAFLGLLDVEVPVIGALNGHAVGGGFGLSLLTDIRVGNESAKYGANFARIGLHSGLGISYLLPRLVGVSQAAELLFTGRLVDGREAARLGLFSAAVPEAEVRGRAMSLAEEIASAAPLAVRGMKASMRRFNALAVRDAAAFEAPLQAATLETEDAKEGMAAILEKRAPVFRGR
jgi:enoyl-CoA hydratase/carnithine racemase